MYPGTNSSQDDSNYNSDNPLQDSSIQQVTCDFIVEKNVVYGILNVSTF